MYAISPPAVYVHESVMADPRYKQRMERVVAGCANEPPVTVFTDDDLPAMIEKKGLLDYCVPMGTVDEMPDPILVFNTFRFDGRFDQRKQWLLDRGHDLGGHTRDALLGYGPFRWFEVDTKERLCRTCWRLHFQTGCVHRCQYCGLGGVLVTMVNVEDYLEQLDRLIELHPWQETYLLEDDADIPGLEPELGCLGPIIEHFGRYDDKYLIIHTKTGHTEWMDGLDHNGKTIVVWSVSGDTQARVLEPVAGRTAERIAAAAHAEALGYIVRYKFKPIVPVKGWREDAREAVKLLFERTHPDVISLCVFMWTPIEATLERLGEENLDESFVAAAREAAESMGDSRMRPFPEEKRAEIYEFYIDEIRKYDAEVPISISTESPEMWGRLSEKLGATAMNYVCGCGPNATPHRKRLECNPIAVAADGPQGGMEAL